MSIFDEFSDDDKKAGLILSRLVKPVNAEGDCPPPEDIAAFIDNQLSEGKRKKVMAHLNNCANCHQLYIETIETMNDIEGEKPKEGIQHILNFAGTRQKAPSHLWKCIKIMSVLLPVYGNQFPLPSARTAIIYMYRALEIMQ